jgi:hypothetical protein
MKKKKCIYLDCCCLNRPFDDQTHDKIRIESAIIMAILGQCFYDRLTLVGSDVLEFEIMKIPDLSRKAKVLYLYSMKSEKISLNDTIQNRALEIQKYGLKPFDSLHFASAEYRNTDVLLTVDKDFIKYARQIKRLIVKNPLNWYMEEMANE